MSLRSFAARHPVAAAVGCAAFQFLLTVLILKAGKAYAPAAAFGKIKLLAFASTVLFPLAMTQALGLWRQVGFGADRLRPTPFFLVSFLPCLVYLGFGVHAPAGSGLTENLLIQFFNALGEELLFRGVIFALLLTLPRWQGIVLSGVLFGGMHTIHGFMDGDWVRALWWAVPTSMAGMMFAAVRYETGSLWLVIGLHMIGNLCKIYSSLGTVAGSPMERLVSGSTNAFEVAMALFFLIAFSRRALPDGQPQRGFGLAR